jgi:hypothetical protein
MSFVDEFHVQLIALEQQRDYWRNIAERATRREPPMNYDACISCKHYFGDHIDGECRRFPPRETRPGHIGTFPRVISEAWCGEHSSSTPTDTTVS